MTPRGPDDGRSTVRTASRSHITALSVADSAPCRHPTALRGAPRRRPARYEWRNTAIDTRGLPIRPPHLMQLDVRRPPNPLHIIDKPVHRVKMRQARASPAPQLAKRRPTPPSDCPDPTRKRHPAHALRHRSPTADRPRLQRAVTSTRLEPHAAAWRSGTGWRPSPHTSRTVRKMLGLFGSRKRPHVRNRTIVKATGTPCGRPSTQKPCAQHAGTHGFRRFPGTWNRFSRCAGARTPRCAAPRGCGRCAPGRWSRR